MLQNNTAFSQNEKASSIKATYAENANKKDENKKLTPRQFSFLNKLKKIKNRSEIEKLLDDSTLLNDFLKYPYFFERFLHQIIWPINGIHSEMKEEYDEEDANF